MNINYSSRLASMMALDAEILIEALRKRKILYIFTAKSYKDSNLKEKAWREVAMELGLSDVFIFSISRPIKPSNMSNCDVDIRK